jgi:hypothetical protein
MKLATFRDGTREGTTLAVVSRDLTKAVNVVIPVLVTGIHRPACSGAC